MTAKSPYFQVPRCKSDSVFIKICLYAFDHALGNAKVVAWSRVKCLKTRRLREGEKILLHLSLPFSPNTLVYLGHIMFGLTAVPVTGCMLPACRVKRRSRRKTDLSVLEHIVSFVHLSICFRCAMCTFWINIVTLNSLITLSPDTRHHPVLMFIHVFQDISAVLVVFF